MELSIDPELLAYMPTVSALTEAGLEQEIVASGGPSDDIHIWKGRNVIVDGHRRYRICRKHGLPYRVKEHDFADKAEAKHWMRKWQGYRRNLNPHQEAMFLAESFAYEEKKKRDSGAKTRSSNVAKQVADQAGVSTRQVYRAKQYAAAMETLPSDIRKLFEDGKLRASSADVATLAGYDEIHQRAILNQVESGEYAGLAAALHGEGNEGGEDEDDLPFENEPTRTNDDSSPDSDSLPKSSFYRGPEEVSRKKESRSKPTPAPSPKPTHDVVTDLQVRLGKLNAALHHVNDDPRFSRAHDLVRQLSDYLEAWRKEVA